MLRRLLALLMLPALVAAVAVGSARAASTSITGTITAGSLSLTAPTSASFSATLDGTDQAATYTVPTTITDATGSGTGWNLTVTSTQFAASGGATLPASASAVTGVVNACAAGSTCTSPTSAVTYPITVPAGSSAPTPVKFFNAAANTGRGRFTNTPTITVSIPANTLAGSYASTLTLAAVSGP